MNKKLKIVIGILFIILIFVFVLYLYLHNEREIVIKEINKINELNNYEDIDMDIKSDGNFYFVEKAIKEYYYDFFYEKSIYEDNNTEALTNYLTPDYLNKNKNNLSKIKSDFNKKYFDCQDSLTVLINMLNEDTIMSYISKYNLGYYYEEFYKECLISDKDDEYQNNYQNTKTMNETKNKYLIELLELLNKNKDKWYVKNDNIYIDGKAILNRYNDLRNKIYDLDDLV